MPIRITADRRISGDEGIDLTGDSVEIGASGITLTVDGQINVRSGGGVSTLMGITAGGGSNAESLVRIGASGSLKVSTGGSAGSVYGFYISPKVSNAGLIEVTTSLTANQGSATGIQASSPSFSFTNSGVLRVEGGTQTYGVRVSGGGRFENTGRIEASGRGGVVAVEYGHPAAESFLNSGTIRANDFGLPEKSYGVIWAADTAITNHGTIAGDVALSTQSRSITNSGTLEGAVELGGASSLFVNSGRITGLVTMGAGADTFSGANGSASTVRGGEGDDRLSAGSGRHTLYGDEGADTIEASADATADYYDGGAGFDVVTYARATAGVTISLTRGVAGADNIFGFEGAVGSAFNDEIGGTTGADSLNGGGGDDLLAGAEGGDTLDGGAGADRLDGGIGADRFVVGLRESGLAAGRLDSVAGWQTEDRIVFANGVSALDYGEGSANSYEAALELANAAIRNGSANYFVVQVGADLIVFADSAADNGGADDAVLLTGRDLSSIDATNIVASPGTPVPEASSGVPAPPALPVSVLGTASISGNMDAAHLSGLLNAVIQKADESEFLADGAGNRIRVVGNAFDYDGSQFIGGLMSRVELTTPGFQFAIQIVNGASPTPLAGWLVNDAAQEAFASLLRYSDIISGSSGSDLLRGYDGSDVLYAGGGGDTVFGGSGNDAIYAGTTRSSAQPTAGANYLRGDEGADYIIGGAGFDDINGNVGNDTAAGGTGDDWVVGGKDNDVLFGEAGGDLVYGNLGSDTCEGGDGNDIVRGGQENDVVFGGAGDDYVSGDKGDDTVTGGAGADLFHTFGDAGLDRVLDFSLAQGDRVLLDAGTQYTLAQVGADTVINMSGGGQMVLVGVQLSSLTPGWIFGA